MIEHEDVFIDRAFELESRRAQTKEVKRYRYMADIRLNQLKLQPIYIR